MACQSAHTSTSKQPTLKRKRCSLDDEDAELTRPAKQIHIYSEDVCIETTSGSSDCFSPSSPSTYDASLGSPPVEFTIVDRHNVPGTVWATRGDTTPHGNKRSMAWSKFRGMGSALTPSESRLTPLPVLSWADSEEVWQAMCLKDEQSTAERDPEMFFSHPGLQPRMRAILLDWLIEVCEVYKLHRETYYLAIDYLDRYLSGPRTVNKGQLQLIGITCLFIAAKVEEIYPPKIQEFAYVTDTACLEGEILDEELVILKALNWNITPITIVGWLSLYMQLTAKSKLSPVKKSPTTSSSKGDAFVLPQFSGLEYTQTCRLLDICSMDHGMATFPYSVIAAAAVAHTFSRQHAMHVSGLSWDALEPCVRWMSPFFSVISDESSLPILPITDEYLTNSSGFKHICPNIVIDESHTLQTHTTTMEMFDKSILRAEQIQTSIIERSPAPSATSSCPVGLLTPPSSSRKSMDSGGGL